MKYVQGARRVGGRCRQSFLSVSVSVVSVSGTENGSPRPKNRDPRDPRTRDNGESTSVALRRPAALKSCATSLVKSVISSSAAVAASPSPPDPVPVRGRVKAGRGGGGVGVPAAGVCLLGHRRRPPAAALVVRRRVNSAASHHPAGHDPVNHTAALGALRQRGPHRRHMPYATGS